MSSTPTVQALQDLYAEIKKAALAKLGEGVTIVGIDLYADTTYVLARKYRELVLEDDVLHEAIQASFSARCTVTGRDAMTQEVTLRMGLTLQGEWRPTEMRTSLRM